MQLPVYLFTGFLEGGKTHIIQESLNDQNFNSGEKTLVLMCEEGVEELDPTQFWGQNVSYEPRCCHGCSSTSRRHTLVVPAKHCPNQN